MKEVRIDVFNPVHFHGGLPFQTTYDIEGLKVSPEVHVYHYRDNGLSAFKGITDKVDAAAKGWRFQYHKSDNPLDEMLTAKTGNVLVLACPNVDKISVIYQAVDRGYELVLSDKPWVIEPEGMPTLEHAVQTAKEKGTLLIDIMTERYELGTIIQRLIMMDKGLFGELEQGTLENPAIHKSSVHVLDKSHMGVVRPPQYFDTRWQGEGIVDVTTHLVDMVHWLMRPDKSVSADDIHMMNATRWVTKVPQADFEAITKTKETTPFLVYCNGEFAYTLDGRVVVIKDSWDLKGQDDSHYSTIEGSNIRVEVIKGPNDKYQQVFLTPKVDSIQGLLRGFCGDLVKRDKGFEGVSFMKEGERFQLSLPGNLYTTHFQHFGEVATQALRYLAGQDQFPRELEYARLLTKYHVTTTALKIARGG